MTVTYTDKVQTSATCGLFRLLLLWHGSLTKAIWLDVLIYFFFYYLLSLVYRLVLCHWDEDSKRLFENLCVYCSRWSKLIPLSFLLGFYVSQVVS